MHYIPFQPHYQPCMCLFRSGIDRSNGISGIIKSSTSKTRLSLFTSIRP
jgi:hypothetical protein